MEGEGWDGSDVEGSSLSAVSAHPSLVGAHCSSMGDRHLWDTSGCHFYHITKASATRAVCISPHSL